MLIQQEGDRFAAVEEQAHAENRNYAIAPLSTDFNDDGYPDLIYSNLNGPLKIFMSQGGENKFLKVRFQKNAKNPGAIVSVTEAGKTVTDFLYSGEGLSSDQSGTLIFGLGSIKTGIDHLTINYLSGKADSVRNVTAHSVIEIK